MTKLIVLVHGLGANANEFWGATPVALETEPSIIRNGYKVYFWGYQTKLGPIGPLEKIPFFSRQTETLEELGEHLWSRLRQWFQDQNYEEVKLIGHSMGGLVVASAVGYGLHENEPRDHKLIKALQGIAFVATPLGGANLADKAEPIFKVFGRNVHIDDLRQGSVSRKKLVTRFINTALRGGYNINLKIFRAANDSVVNSAELIEPLAKELYELDVLSGGHSECIKNLEANDENLKLLVSWITAEAQLSSEERLTQDSEMIAEGATIIGLTAEVMQKLVNLLEPHMRNERQRRSLLLLSVGDLSVLRDLDWSGSANTFIPEVIDRLADFGNLPFGGPALRVLLEYVRSKYGPHRQREINALLAQIYG